MSTISIERTAAELIKELLEQAFKQKVNVIDDEPFIKYTSESCRKELKRYKYMKLHYSFMLDSDITVYSIDDKDICIHVTALAERLPESYAKLKKTLPILMQLLKA